jgi:3-dehydroquinate dehydratase-1
MICVSIIDSDFKKCLKTVQKAELSEIRLDAMNLTDEQIVELFSQEAKTIATCRPGKFTDEERKQKLSLAISSGATYVDVEIESADAFKQELLVLASEHECKFIISYHNYQITPTSDKLEAIIEQSLSDGADVVKIACMVNAPKDNARLMGLYRPGVKIVSIGMGETGKISRIAAPYLGAEFTFASTSKKTVTAPGQFTVEEMEEIFKLIDE